MCFEIDISNRQTTVPINTQAIHSAVRVALEFEQVAAAVLSISIVDNTTIHALNRDHLQHDCPTDVVSFQLGFEPDSDGSSRPLRASGASIEGDIIASAEMAADRAEEGRWTTQDELILYVIHGLLHICGYDDLTTDEQTTMRVRERTILNAIGLEPLYAEETP